MEKIDGKVNYEIDKKKIEKQTERQMIERGIKIICAKQMEKQMEKDILIY